MIDEGVIARLTSDAKLLSLVGLRVYPQAAPPGPGPLYPYITFHFVSNVPVMTMDGETTLVHSRMEINCYSDGSAGGSIKQARQIARAVRDSISGFAGAWGNEYVQSCIPMDVGRDLYEPPASGQGRGVFRISCDYMLAHNDPAPALT